METSSREILHPVLWQARVWAERQRNLSEKGKRKWESSRGRAIEIISP
jgi:hypothetical protein